MPNRAIRFIVTSSVLLICAGFLATANEWRLRDGEKSLEYVSKEVVGTTSQGFTVSARLEVIPIDLVPHNQRAAPLIEPAVFAVVKNIIVMIDGKRILVPSTATDGLSDPWPNTLLLAERDDEILVRFSGSDGAGAWEVTYVFSRHYLLRREVESDEFEGGRLVTSFIKEPSN